jgi:maleamate amidohydrolase
MSKPERIWDKFLSERDKKLYHDSYFSRSRVGFGKKPALILIDNYVAGLGDTPLPLEESSKSFPLSCGLEGWAAVAQQERLLDLCRKLDVLVIHTNIDIAPNSPLVFYSSVRADPSKRTKKSDGSVPFTAESQRMFDFTPTLAPIGEEIVILKPGASAFFGTPLLGALNRFGIDTLLICGESTSGCVRATVIDASMYSYHAIVVEECVYDRTEASHAINLFDMDQKYAEVKGIEEVLAWLSPDHAA